MGGGDVQPGDAQGHAAADVAVGEQVVDDGLGGVGGNGEAQPLHVVARAFGVDQADEPAVAVEQAAPGVARVDGGVGLQQGHDLPVDGDLAPQGADDAVRHRAAQLAQGIADGHHRLAHHQGVGVAKGGVGQVLGVDLQHGHVRLHIGGNQLGLVGLAAAQGHTDIGGPVDDVVVGGDHAVGGDDHTASRALGHVLLHPIARRDHLGDDLHHRVGGRGGHLRYAHHLTRVGRSGGKHGGLGGGGLQGGRVLPGVCVGIRGA